MNWKEGIKMGRKLGYKWYDKDWATNEKVAELNLEERGFYRELIDLAMRRDNKVNKNIRWFSRNYNSNPAKIKKLLSRLESVNVIEIEDDIITVPSCWGRISAINIASKGGNATAENRRKAEEEGALKGTLKGTLKEKKVNETKQKETIVEEVSNCDWFIESWNLNLIEHTNAKVGSLTFLTKEQKDSISKLLNDGLEIDDIKKGIVGLMVQKLFPNNQNLIYPNHLLKNDGEFVQKYAIAYNTNNLSLIHI